MTDPINPQEQPAALKRRRAPSPMGIAFDVDVVATTPPAGFSDRQFPQLGPAAPKLEAALEIAEHAASSRNPATEAPARLPTTPRPVQTSAPESAREKVFFGLRMSRDLRERFQIYAIRHRTSAQDLVVGFVESLLESDGANSTTHRRD